MPSATGQPFETWGASRLWLELVCKQFNWVFLHVPIVGPTGRSDPGYVRLSVRPVGQTGRTDCSREPLTSVNQINVAC